MEAGEGGVELESGILVPFLIRTSVSGADENRHLLVRVDPVGTDTRSGARKLVVELTDPADLLFLYSLVLPDVDYIALKKEQGLTVDITGFPDEMTRLLRGASAPDPGCVRPPLLPSFLSRIPHF